MVVPIVPRVSVAVGFVLSIFTVVSPAFADWCPALSIVYAITFVVPSACIVTFLLVSVSVV